jgi:predicted metal-binding membrane protein
MRAIPASERLFFAVSVLLFAAGAIATVACSTTNAGASFGMSEMSGPMSMAWMRMPGQSLPAFASTFLGMWIVMMMAMMLPSLVPVLARYRKTLVLAGAARPDRLAAVAGAGYFVVWNLFGVGAFALGSTLASAAMQWPALARACRSLPARSCCLRAPCNSPPGRRTTSPAADRRRAPVHRQASPRPGNTEYASACIAVVAASA